MFTIFGYGGCVYCDKAKELLTDNEQGYTYVDVTTEGGAKYLKSVAEEFNLGELGSVPQIFYGLNNELGGHYIGGHSKLVWFLSSFKFKQMSLTVTK